MSTNFNERIAAGIENRAQRKALGAAMRRGREGRASALLQVEDPDAFVRNVRRIKEQSIEQLDKLIDEFTTNASKRGAKVFFAKDGQAAIDYVSNVARIHNAKLVAKSKSLTTDEIEINQPLEEMGYEVVETDLGERIIQLAHEKPIHLVFPASHKSVQQIAEIFSAQTHENVQADHKAITNHVRRKMRAIFLDADIGITGANIAIAETGTLVIETNEGNARLVTSLPKVHIAVVGIEKIVSRIEDAVEMFQAHPLSATGSKLTTYVSLITGRSPLGTEQDSRELHIVLLDNGRQKIRQDEDIREALYCIRCGACMNICPTYEVVGGHVFGHIYPGPIGIPWTSAVHGLDKAEFASLCISCGLCHEMCPADIDIPYLIAKVKELKKNRSGQPFVNQVVMRSDQLARLGSLTAPLSNWILKRDLSRFVLEKLMGIERRRRLPTFSRQSFNWWWKHHNSPYEKTAQHRVAYFVDVYANYNRPDIGIGAVLLLEKCGVSVFVPRQETSGMPYFSYGELDKARRIAEANVASMFPLVRDGFEVVATEPTAAYCFKELYPRLLGNEESKLVGGHTHEFLEYLYTNFMQDLNENLKPTF
jgi:L-lactate dehydrogenase complex protein LldF